MSPRYTEVLASDVTALDPDSQRCTRSDCVCPTADGLPAPLGWHLEVREDFHPYWGDTCARFHVPFTPVGTDPLHTASWVCEECAYELEQGGSL